MIHEHHARSLHWDLRLERDGVLVSWAVPKGIPPDPKKNHLAVHVEDHPLDYIDFAGDIPEGNYGAGTVKIWDKGTYETEKFRDDEVMITFHGERLEGKYVLFQTKGNQWMIHRMDPPSGGAREPMPDKLVPMLAKLAAALPRNDADYGYEIKWDGIRALAYIDGGRAALREPQRPRHHEHVSRAARAGRRGGHAPADPRRRDRDLRRGRAAELRAPPEPHAPGLRRRDQAPHGGHPGRLHDLRRAVPRRPLDDVAALHASAASCWTSS